MKRKNFLTTALLSIPAIAFAKSDFLSKEKKPVTRPTKGFIVRANESRFLGKQTDGSNLGIHCKISTADTDGDLMMGATNENLKFKGGPALHYHEKEDEIFYVVSGEYLIQVGDEIFLAKKGDTAFIPRGTHHTFACPDEKYSGILISIFQSGDKQMEADFETFASGKIPENWEKNASWNVGPPIDIEAALKKISG